VISVVIPYHKRRLQILGSEIAYVEVGEGDPIVFLHGNPASSYVWRNVIPAVAGPGRCLAPDLIGMGDSDKLPNSGPGSYSFVEYRRFLDALLETLGVFQRATLVVHDWGSALGFDWANRHRDAVTGIVYLEALVRPLSWDEFQERRGESCQALRSPGAKAMLLEQDLFGSPRDVLLTALAAALPYLMVVFATAVAWLLTGRAAARPAAEPDAASSAVQTIDRTGSVGTREWRGLRRIAAALPRSTSKGVIPTAGAGVNGMSRRFEAFRAERVGVTMRQREWQAKL
jgi:pimeloyl-ACP methyl ester carboxylesterase